MLRLNALILSAGVKPRARLVIVVLKRLTQPDAVGQIVQTAADGADVADRHQRRQEERAAPAQEELVVVYARG